MPQLVLSTIQSVLFTASHKAANILSHVFLRDEELRAEIFFYNDIGINNSDRADPGENEVFGDFVGERTEGYEQHFRVSHAGGSSALRGLEMEASRVPCLCFHAP